MTNQTLEILKEQNTEAIKNGHQFPGYFGCLAEEFTRSELIMLLNIVYSELKEPKNLSCPLF